MNKQKLIWALVVAVPVGLAAVVAGYFFTSANRLLPQETAETEPVASGEKSGSAETQVASTPSDGAGESRSEQGETVAEAGAEEPAPEAPLEGPSFDVVGIEPTGETVVAGRSDAGAIVALTANGEVVGKSIANEAGEWTIILEAPLEPGDYDVGLEVHDEVGGTIEQSQQRLAVSIPEGGKEQPLVVLNAPDGPSDILQRPATGQQLAQAPAGDASESTVRGAATPQAADTGTAEAEDAALPSDTVENGVAGTSSGQAATTGSGTEGASGDAQSTVKTAAAGDRTGSTIIGSASDSNEATPGQTAGVGDTESSAFGEPATQTGAASDQERIATLTLETPGSADAQAQGAAPSVSATVSGASQGAQQATPKVTVEAVESEPDKVYIAGTAKPGSSVRVYIGEEYQGEARVNSSGRWLVEGTKNLAEGDVEVRADLIAEDGSSVDARAAVTFEKEQDKQIVLTKVVATGAGSGQGSQGADVQKSLPVVIIRKGDNLWRISRRLYGDGVRYTTIYQANQDQIRDPDLIYPGQVFLTPEGDLNWAPSDGDTANNG